MKTFFLIEPTPKRKFCHFDEISVIDALKVVILTTFSAGSDENFINNIFPSVDDQEISRLVIPFCIFL